MFTDNGRVSTTDSKPLPTRVERFVAEYIADGCASAAATRAGYSAAASKQAHYRLLRRDDVKEALREHCGRLVQQQAQQVEHIVLDGERTRRAIADLAHFDVRAFVNPDGTAKNLHELDAQSAAAVAGFEVTEAWVSKSKAKRKVVTTTYRLANRVTALDIACKILGQYAKDIASASARTRGANPQITERINQLLGRAGLAEPPGTPLQ